MDASLSDDGEYSTIHIFHSGYFDYRGPFLIVLGSYYRLNVAGKET